MHGLFKKNVHHTMHNIIIVDEYIFLFKFLSNWGKSMVITPMICFRNFDKAAVTIHLASEITYSWYVDRRWWDLLDSIHLRVFEMK